MAKRKGQKDNQRSTKHTHKTKDRVTRTSLKTGVNKQTTLFSRLFLIFIKRYITFETKEVALLDITGFVFHIRTIRFTYCVRMIIQYYLQLHSYLICIPHIKHRFNVASRFWGLDCQKTVKINTLLSPSYPNKYCPFVVILCLMRNGIMNLLSLSLLLTMVQKLVFFGQIPQMIGLSVIN